MRNWENAEKTGIFFITGRPRTGTTLLRTLLDTHTQIVVPFECSFIVDLYPRYAGIERWNKETKEIFLHDFLNQPLLSFWNLDKDKLKKKVLQLPEGITYAGLCRFLLLQFSSITAKDHIIAIGDKNPVNTLHFNKLSRLFPDAKFIHLLRDPRDQIASMKSVDFELPWVTSLSYRWKYFNRKADKFRKKHPERILYLRYEDLVSRPKEEMQKIFSFLNIPYDESIFNFYETREAFEEKYSKEYVNRHHSHLFQPISTGRIGNWDKKLTRYNLKMIDAVTGRYAKRFGYVSKTKGTLIHYCICLPGVLYGISYYWIYGLLYRFPVGIKRKALLKLDRTV